MDVVLDTNIYYSLIYTHGGQFTSANHFVELVTYLKRTNSNLVVPTIVLDELSAKYKREFSQQVKDARDAYESMTRNMMDEWQNFPDPDIDEQVEMLRLQLVNPSKGFKSKIVDAYKNISTEEVAHRGIERIRPASAKGEELRDVMIWLFALEHAKNGKIAFISDDGGYQGNPGDLHADLVNDLKHAKVDIRYYASLPKFITENSLKSEPAIAEEMAALISLAEVSKLAEPSLINLRTRQGKVTNAKIKSLTLVNAQKYSVADDAFYIEANYTVETALVLESALYVNAVINTLATTKQPQSLFEPGPLNTIASWNPGLASSGWNPGVFVQPAQPSIFGRIGNVLSPPLSGVSYEPTVVHYEYDAELAMKFSVRVSGKNKESLQLEELEILKLTIRRPEPQPAK